MIKTYKIYVFILLSVLIFSCTRNDAKFIRLDMSKEHDAVRFKPETGSRVCIAGNFNNWQSAEYFLTDENGDWIYTIPVNEIFNNSNQPLDTLIFKFYQISGDERSLNEIEQREKLGSRKMAYQYLLDKDPLFIFNQTYDEKIEVLVKFTVGISNQKILGYFRPELGDEIIVSGSFCDWDPNGLQLNDEDKDDIYTLTSNIRIYKNNLFEYKYRIMNNREAILLNSGWENIKNRTATVSDTIELPYIEFGDMRRIARFIVNMEKRGNEKIFKPLKGDILQVNLSLDSKEILTDALLQIDKNTYETAVIIPINVKNIRYQIVKNIKNPITKMENIEVDLNGSIIKVNI